MVLIFLLVGITSIALIIKGNSTLKKSIGYGLLGTFIIASIILGLNVATSIKIGPNEQISDDTNHQELHKTNP